MSAEEILLFINNYTYYFYYFQPTFLWHVLNIQSRYLLASYTNRTIIGLELLIDTNCKVVYINI